MKTFKILCIDGGGILGLYSAAILHQFEAALQREHGRDARIVDYVDLICGTSTGGLIALALSLGISSEIVCSFYEKHGPKIFHGSESIFALLRQAIFRGKFSDKYLRFALEDMFGNHTIGDSNCLLCIPTYDFTHSTYGVFKFDHKEGNLTRHNNLSMVDVALATSAAPTYFPLAQIESENNTQYVDGGVWANNPSLVGLTEALTYFVGPGKLYECVNLLSISTLSTSTANPPLTSRYKSFLQWAPDLFQLSLIGQSEFADIFLNRVEKTQILPISYTRISSPKAGGQQAKYIKLDYANEASFSLLKQFANDAYYRNFEKPKVRSFFSELKTYSTNVDS